ncbi:hypothetical protein QCA50_007496 [Cerrena zonata]|uniref:Uncharacterized protein n=1 Tax=Cerrena zonata TaxID=2478898 RepID=A0AAW0GJP0_9APHY
MNTSTYHTSQAGSHSLDTHNGGTAPSTTGQWSASTTGTGNQAQPTSEPTSQVQVTTNSMLPPTVNGMYTGNHNITYSQAHYPHGRDLAQQHMYPSSTFITFAPGHSHSNEGIIDPSLRQPTIAAMGEAMRTSVLTASGHTQSRTEDVVGSVIGNLTTQVVGDSTPGQFPSQSQTGQGKNKRTRNERESDDESAEEKGGTKYGISDRNEDPLKRYAHAFCHLGGVFTPIVDIVKGGVQWEIVREAGHLGDMLLPLTDFHDEEVMSIQNSDKRRMIQSWIILCNIIPGFRDKMIDKVKRHHPIEPTCDKLQAYVLNTRANDSGSLKTKCLSYIRKDHSTPQPELHGHDINNKRKRGWAHPEFAILLMPVKYDPTPKTILALKTNQPRFSVTHKQLPCFLYPEGHVWDRGNEEVGLFEGHFFTYVTQHLFTSPSSVFAVEGSGKASRKGCVAERIGITALTERCAAYAGIQAQHMLNTQEEWERIDGAFNVEKFYWTLVSILENGEEGKALMAKINRAIFGNAVGQASTESDDSDDETPDARILRQRESHKAA